MKGGRAMTHTLVIILLSLQNNAPAITNIAGFKISKDCSVMAKIIKESTPVYDLDGRVRVITFCVPVD
jgi:hypothetical protein